MEAVVRFDGAVAVVLEKLVDMGYFRTRSEAIRAGVLELGKEYNLLKSPQEVEDELVVRKLQRVEEEAKKKNVKFVSLDDALKRAGLGRRDLK